MSTIKRHLTFMHVGDGIVVYDVMTRGRSEHQTVATIAPNREVNFIKPLIEEDKFRIIEFARTQDPTTSKMKPDYIFLTRPII